MEPMPDHASSGSCRVPLVALGVPVDVEVSGDRAPELCAALAEPWAWCERKSGSVASAELSAKPAVVRATLSSSASVVEEAALRGEVASMELSEVLHLLSPAVTMAAIDARAGELWMLHAACLVAPSGAAVALVGNSGVGKTTASRELARTLGYATDETTAISASGLISVYPKPLSVIVPSSPWKQQVSPASLGLMPVDGAVRLGAVVLLRRSLEYAEPVVRPVRTMEAIVRLAEQSSYLARMVAPLSFMASVVDAVGGAVEVSYAEASTLLPVVSELLEGR